MAREWVRPVGGFGFETHGLQRISVTAAAHTAARRVMEKAGTPSIEPPGKRGRHHERLHHSTGDIIMPTNTVRLHRVLRATPERIYRAFLDPDAMVKWLPPNGFTGKVHHLDAKAGGTYRMSFTNFTTRHSHSFGGEYLELVPQERIRYTGKFDDPNIPGVMQTTVSLRAVSVGTELSIVQEGIPDLIPVEACYLGWQESLVLLAKLVEAEIPD